MPRPLTTAKHFPNGSCGWMQPRPGPRQEYAAARGFFLTAWGGKERNTFDRIGRGRVHIEGACLSMIGSTQPGRLAEYVRRAVTGTSGDDGLIQRFGHLVWPDQSPAWEHVD